MSRLTNKDDRGRYYTVEEKIFIANEPVNPTTTWIVHNENRRYGSPIEKLGKLEDLEEQLGCPLEVVLGFLTHNITEIIIEYDLFSGNYASQYCTDEDIVKAYVSSIYDQNEIDGISEPELVVETNMGTFPLSDYKEHWWLKEDKSE